MRANCIGFSLYCIYFSLYSNCMLCVKSNSQQEVLSALGLKPAEHLHFEESHTALAGHVDCPLPEQVSSIFVACAIQRNGINCVITKQWETSRAVALQNLTANCKMNVQWHFFELCYSYLFGAWKTKGKEKKKRVLLFTKGKVILLDCGNAVYHQTKR